MLAHVLLYLALVFSGLALLTLLLLRQAVAEHGAAPRPVLIKASRWAGLLFLVAAVAIAFGGGPESVSLMARSGLAPGWPAAGLPGAAPEQAAPFGQAQAAGFGGAAPGVGEAQAPGTATGKLPGAAVILSAEVLPSGGTGTTER
jgi:hypothetical protein